MVNVKYIHEDLIEELLDRVQAESDSNKRDEAQILLLLGTAIKGRLKAVKEEIDADVDDDEPYDDDMTELDFEGEEAS